MVLPIQVLSYCVKSGHILLFVTFPYPILLVNCSLCNSFFLRGYTNYTTFKRRGGYE